MEPTFSTRWFYLHATGQQVELGLYTCAVCGLPTHQTVPLKSVLRSTFTDYSILRVRNDQDACPACEWYMANQAVRRACWHLTQNEARAIAKSDWLSLLQEHITSGTPADAYYLIKQPGPTGKHLALLASMTCAGSNTLRIQFETTALELDTRWLELVGASHRLSEFHSWKEIERDNYIAAFTRRWGDLSEFVRLRQVVKPWCGTPQFDLAKYVWTKGDDKDGDGNTSEAND